MTSDPQSATVKPATVYDVAKLAGVSAATVSFAFSRPERVREQTRDAVLAAAHALGYVPSASARSLAVGRHWSLGLFSYDYFVRGAGAGTRPGAAPGTAPGTDPPVRLTREADDEGCRDFPLYVDEVQRGMALACRAHGYTLMIGGPSQRDEIAVPVTDIAGRVDGLAVFPQTLPLPALARIARRIPVVALSDPPQDDRLSHVSVANRAGTRALTEHLIRDHGRRDLLFIGALNPAEGQDRFDGYVDALRAAGLRAPRAAFVPPARLTAHGRPTFDLPAGMRLPEGFVCATDEVALTVLDRLAERGVRVPQDVAVTGFDGIAGGRVARPALTTVHQPMVDIGRQAVEVLVERLARPADPPILRELPVTVVLRESCGCPPRGPNWR